MSVTPSHIAASLAQSPLQQRQTAAATDDARNSAARASQRMRHLIARHMEAVEDAYETSDEPLIIQDHPDSGPRNQADDGPADDEPDESPAPPPAPAPGPQAGNSPPSPGAAPGHIDIQA